MTEIASINIQGQINTPNNTDKETKITDPNFFNLMSSLLPKDTNAKEHGEYTEFSEGSESENLEDTLEEAIEDVGVILFNPSSIQNIEKIKLSQSKEANMVEEKGIQLEEQPLINNDVNKHSNIEEISVDVKEIVNKIKDNQFLNVNEFNIFKDRVESILKEIEVSPKDNKILLINISNLQNELNKISNKILKTQMLELNEFNEIGKKIQNFINETEVVMENTEIKFQQDNTNLIRVSSITEDGKQILFENPKISQIKISNLLNKVNEISSKIAENQLTELNELDKAKEMFQNIIKELEDVMEKVQVNDKEYKTNLAAINTDIGIQNEISLKNNNSLQNNINKLLNNVNEITQKSMSESNEFIKAKEEIKNIITELQDVIEKVEVNSEEYKTELSRTSTFEGIKRETSLKDKQQNIVKNNQNIDIIPTNNNYNKFVEEPSTITNELKIDNLDEIVKELSVETNTLNNDEKSTMKIKLKPQELGELSFQLEKKADSIIAKIVVRTNEAKHLIEKNIQLLHNSVGNNNFKIVEITVDNKNEFVQEFSFNSEGENNSQNENFFNDEDQNNRKYNEDFIEEIYSKKQKTKGYSGRGSVREVERNINILI